MKRVIILVTLCGVIKPEADLFFHKPSITKLLPFGDHSVTSQFGFSIAYQDNTNSTPARLVVGAPRHDFVGTVYTCPISTLAADVGCSEVDMTHLNLVEKTNESREYIKKDLSFFFGSSIVATSDYFLTCAPLLTKSLSYKQGRQYRDAQSMDVVGACFLYDTYTNKYTEWIDNIVKLVTYSKNVHLSNVRKHKFIFNSEEIIKTGGVGWNTLVDPDTGYMLVAKTTNIGDLLYVNIDKPLEVSNSLVEDYNDKYYREFSNYFNFGYGMTVGKFFDDYVSAYAFSVVLPNLKGRILFVEKLQSSNKLDIKQDSSTADFQPYYIETSSLGSMFGYALAAADINQDGFSELLVGTPAQSIDKNRREPGALHIYIGGRNMLSDSDDIRMRTILGNEENGRFGSAIATNDIDGDNIPEIFISAPYEDEGSGVVYVISGYELKQILGDKFKQIWISELAQTQKLRGVDSGFKLFGFSLQIVEDVDNNGCNELAVGSPESSSVLLLRCLPSVVASTSLEQLGDKIVKENATTFTVSVCLNVTITAKCNSIVGSILVKSSVTGNSNIKKPVFFYELTTKKLQRNCENVIVDLPSIESAEYIFSTELDILEVDKNGDRKKKDYKPWAVLSPYSELKNRIRVKRHCTDEECKPKLAYTMTWLGGNLIDTATSQRETAVITVNNTGSDAVASYLQLTVHGTKISQLPEKCFIANATNEYTCPLPMKQGSSHKITVLLNTTEPINTPFLEITAQLYDTMFNVTYKPQVLTVPYQLNPSLVLVNGSTHDLTVTDKDINNADIITVNDSHEYYIFNSGTVLWTNVIAILEIQKESYIQDVKVLSEGCLKNHDSEFKFHCKLTIGPGVVVKIIANIAISKDSIKMDIIDGDLGASSNLSLILQPTKDIRVIMSSTQLKYQQILSAANDKTLVICIAVAVTLILFLILVFILYKLSFFKRAEKKRLDVLRESVRKRSIRMASESSRSQKPSITECDIEVVEEVFQEIDITQSPQSSKDDVVLIKETASIE